MLFRKSVQGFQRKLNCSFINFHCSLKLCFEYLQCLLFLKMLFFIPRVNCQSYKNSYSGYEEGGSKGYELFAQSFIECLEGKES